MNRTTFTAGLLVMFGTPLAGQQSRALYPLPRDIATMDGIIKAYYEIVSGPAGESADRARDESIHLPGARVGIAGVDENGTPRLQSMTIGEYHDRFGGPRTRPFYEWELHRVTQRFGSVAHVWSTYASSDVPGGAPSARGINSIQLYFDGLRWWVTGWIFDSERAGNPIPAEYLPGN